MARVKAESSKREPLVSLAILTVLVGIAIGVYFKQFRYDRAVFTVTLSEQGSFASPSSNSSGSSGLEVYLPDGMVPLTPPESFGPNNLSDKINGKAELYLSAGFLSLHSQRFVKTENSNVWMEVFVYDMGTMRNAFSVYGTQKRTDAEKVDLAPFAYRTSNAVFFVHGQEYVEIVAATATEEMATMMLSFAKNFIRNRPVETHRLGELALFPPEHLDEESISLLASDVFSFQRLNNIWIAGYTIDDTPLTAFLSLRETSQEAAELVAAYCQFLIENGGTEEKLNVNIPGARVVRIFDTFEMIWSHDKLLAGVHEAERLDLAEKLALTLYRKLSEVNR
jgi:hypothetical protein